MTERCDQLHAYVDGELDDDAATEFEAHLATCEACLAELPHLLALLEALDGAGRVARAAAPAESRAAGVPSAAPAAFTVIPGGRAPEPATGAAEVRAPQARTAARPGRGRRSAWIAGFGAAMAAAAALVVFLVIRPPRPTGTDVASLEPVLGTTRPIAPRLDYPGADRHRALDVQRGGLPGRSTDGLLQFQLTAERAGNWHGVAVASLLAGDLERARQAFARAPASPEVDADRAALDLAIGTPDALERALEDVDRALAARPALPAAIWNRALVLAALDLPLAAARELDRIAALGEPGWTAEARQRAAALRQTLADRRALWQRAIAAKRALIADGVPVPADTVRVTGYMTLIFYDAVRAAPSRAAAEALLPLAQALDTAYRSDRLTAYVRRIAASDFEIRKPLADGYRALLFGPAMPDAEVDSFLHRLEHAGAIADDIRLGALVRVHRVARELEPYRKLAAATNDPWFIAIAEEETAVAELGRGSVAAAERRLRAAIEAAERERLVYRALALREQLFKLYGDVQHLAQAAEQARIELHEAVTAGEALTESSALANLTAVNQNRYASGLVRAYATELLERTQPEPGAERGPSPLTADRDCQTLQYALQSLASLALDEFAPDRARSLLARSPTCKNQFNTLTLQRAMIGSDLYRLGHRATDAAVARDSLAMLRQLTLSTAEQAFAELVDGNLVADDDRAASARHLRDAIDRADHHADPANLNVKARAYGFALLATSAGRAGDFHRVLDLVTENLEVPRPPRCALAIAHYAEHTVVAFSDARGEIGGSYTTDQRSAELDVGGLVPAATVARLRGCARVAVLTRAPVLGAGRLLPPELAWSYVLGGPAPAPAPAPASATRSRLVIANPEAPPELHLPALGPYPDELSRDATVLRGAEATPSRVLLAMRDAAVIEFHTHGFIGNDVTEASYLVLSPEPDHQYALTAADVAQVPLAAAPLVILGACHAAASSRSLEGGMGLAEAFLRSGARTVIASPDAVPDRDATALFAAVRDRVLRGADPASALRDERLRRSPPSPDDAWLAGVVVFERPDPVSM
jgi:hypothetical protein